MKKYFIVPIFVVTTFFAVATPASALDDNARGAISQYCGSIRNILQSLQREDARTRVAVGSIYETISNLYLVPLNLRLVSNNIASPGLVELQSDFANSRSSFASKFIEYSRNFEDLLAINCQADPDTFYTKLVSVRSLRAELATVAQDLRASATSALPIISSLKESL